MLTRKSHDLLGSDDADKKALTAFWINGTQAMRYKGYAIISKEDYQVLARHL
jgi:hypothetical protein